MNLLAAKLYDPAAAVSKATSALLAMTAFDTTNLRLAVTVPAHGMVRFRLRCMLEGATTFPAILLGVLNGATVVGRVSPMGAPDGTALATTFCTQDAEFTATGLTPGAANFDAAYGVETVVAATNIKYGGPNNTTANDAFGAFVFEAWDPQPQQTNGQLVVDANGRVDVIKVAGTTQTAGDLKASLNTLQTDTDDIQTRLPAALVAGRIDASIGAMAANVLTAAAVNAAALNGKGDWNIGKTGYDLVAAWNAAKTAAQAGDAMALTAAAINLLWDELTSEGRTAGSYGQLFKDNVNASIAAVKAKTDNLPVDPADASDVAGAFATVNATLATIASYIDTEVAAIKSKTDNLPASPAATGDAMTLTAAYNAAKTAAQAGDAMTLTAGERTATATALLDLAAAVEGYTLRQILRLFAAALVGKANGLAGTTAHYRDVADTKDRITATVDADGNRTAVALDAT